MIPKLRRVSQHTFDRIGDHYGPYIDGEHFMGRSACDDIWMKTHNAPVNVKYEKERCIILVFLSGFHRDEINLHFDDDALYLRAVKSTGKSFQKTKNVNRNFSIPPHTDRDKITANFSDGIMEIVLPRKAAREADIAFT